MRLQQEVWAQDTPPILGNKNFKGKPRGQAAYERSQGSEPVCASLPFTPHPWQQSALWGWLRVAQSSGFQLGSPHGPVHQPFSSPLGLHSKEPSPRQKKTHYHEPEKPACSLNPSKQLISKDLTDPCSPTPKGLDHLFKWPYALSRDES